MTYAEKLMVAHNRLAGWCRDRNGVWTRPYDYDCPVCPARPGEPCSTTALFRAAGMTHVVRPIQYWSRPTSGA